MAIGHARRWELLTLGPWKYAQIFTKIADGHARRWDTSPERKRNQTRKLVVSHKLSTGTDTLLPHNAPPWKVTMSVCRMPYAVCRRSLLYSYCMIHILHCRYIDGANGESLVMRV
jgi:hypothetical protein